MCTTITYYTRGYDSVKMDLVRYPEMAPERPGAAYSTSSTFSIPGESAFSLVQPSSRSTASWDISSSPLYSSRRSYEELTPPEDYSLYRCRELSSPSNTMLLEQGNSSNSPIKLELDSSSTGITSFYRNQESLERYKSVYGVEGEPYRQPSSHWEAASGTEVGVIVTHQQQQQRTQRRLSRGGVRRRSGCSSADRAPSPSVMKKRRLAANARERRRMNGLNEAFDRLREVIPSLGEDHKLSKFETLQMAQTYISALCDLLDRGKR